MPWCQPCSRYFAPSALHADGSCPVCGAAVEGTPEDRLPEHRPPEESSGAPWHFWVVVAALVLYLGWRLVQGIVWVVGRF